MLEMEYFLYFCQRMPERNSNNKSSRRTKQAPIDTTFGHLQPQATDIEKVVLGALMIDKDAFLVVSEIIKPETFYESRHEKIYEAVQSLNLQEKPVDIMTVVEELRHRGTLEEVGGAAYIVELSSNVASSAHIEYHAHILAQKFLARQLIQFASMIETDAFDETVDVDELMQKAEGTLFEISQKNMLQDYVQIDTIVEQAHQLLLKAAGSKDKLTGVPSGFHDLDKITAGWQASDLVIIAGRPAMGKTSFALSIAKNIAAEGAVLCGNIDAILLTGGMAKSDYIIERLKQRLSFLAPIYVYPGQDEMQALTENALAVLRGEREAKDY